MNKRMGKHEKPGSTNKGSGNKGSREKPKGGK